MPTGNRRVLSVVIQADCALGGDWLAERLGLGRLGLGLLGLGRPGFLAVSTLAATRRSCNSDVRLRHDSQP